MLAATLRAGGEDLPVRVRNLSETGALIEGTKLPAADVPVMLLRNTLLVTGTIVWSRPGQAGLRFADVIEIRGWIKPGPSAAPTTAGQARVDTIQTAARAGLSTIPARPLSDARHAELAAAMPSRIVEELAYIRRLVESIGDELVSEPAIVCRHASALQKFDLAAQMLGLLGTILLADDQVAAAENIGQQELKARLLRKA